MTKLEELIYSLATAIVCYYDTQKGVKKLIVESDPTTLRKKSREYAIGIILNPKFDDQLKGLIDVCTNGYADRKHFLTFLLREISFLKMQLNKELPYNEEEIAKYQKQVTKLLIDFKQLLNTPKGKKYEVTHSDDNTGIDLKGMINDAYWGNHFCNSGTFLIDEVFNRFHITPSSSEEELTEVAMSLCTEHQNTLLVTELQKQNLQLQTEKALLESEKEDFAEKNKVLEETIGTMQKELGKTKEELQKVQSLDLKGKQSSASAQQTKSNPMIYPMFSGLSGAFNTMPYRGIVGGPKPIFFQPTQSPTPPQTKTTEDDRPGLVPTEEENPTFGSL